MVSLSHAVRYFLSSLVVLFLPDCAPVHPTTERVCISGCGDSFRHRLVLVWSHDPTVDRLLLDWVRGQDAQIVDPVQFRMRFASMILSLNLSQAWRRYYGISAACSEPIAYWPPR
jgi:hypothetical protein